MSKKHPYKTRNRGRIEAYKTVVTYTDEKGKLKVNDFERSLDLLSHNPVVARQVLEMDNEKCCYGMAIKEMGLKLCRT